MHAIIRQFRGCGHNAKRKSILLYRKVNAKSRFIGGQVWEKEVIFMVFKDKEYAKAYMRKYRAKNVKKCRAIWKKYYSKTRLARISHNIKMAKLHPEKCRARLKARRMYKKLGIKVDICSNCNKKKICIKHHHDYSKPLEVIFLCNSCHSLLHKGTPLLHKGESQGAGCNWVSNRSISHSGIHLLPSDPAPIFKQNFVWGGIKINKYLILFATIIMTFLTAYSLPIVFASPSTSNLVICGLFALMMVLGFWTFVKAGSKKEEKVEVNGRILTPVEI